jgi:hypothetical protein
MYPTPSDERWQNPDGSGKPFTFANVPGPASLPYQQAVAAISQYVTQVNKLGKDFEDPDGKDDNWEKDPGRALILPKGRPIEVQLSSKDVIHDFFLPNFRVKLDAVPGMRGHIYFKSLMSSTEREAKSRRTYKIDEVIAAMKDPAMKELTIAVGESDQAHGATFDKRAKQWLFKDSAGTIVRNGKTIMDATEPAKNAERLKAAGVTEITAYIPGDWELVCEELCGQGHATMRGQVIILESGEYDKLNLDKPYKSVGSPVAVNDSK